MAGHLKSPSAPVALVTGASTGIGLAVSRSLWREGYHVILTARESSLVRFRSHPVFSAPGSYWLRPLDVRDSRAIEGLAAEVEREFGRLDVLVNNAGVFRRGPLERAGDAESRELLSVNFLGPMEMVRAFAPLMRRSGGGRVIMLSSAAGFFSVPTMGLYSASKHALEGASEALFYELKPWNIHVTLIEPGFVGRRPAYLEETASSARRGLVSVNPVDAVYVALGRGIAELVESAFQLTTSTPEDVAEQIVRVLSLKRPPLRRAVTLDARVFSFLKRFLPATVFHALVAHCLGLIRARSLRQGRSVRLISS